MSAVSALLKSIQAVTSESVVVPQTQILTSPIRLSSLSLTTRTEPSHGYTLEATSGPYRYCVTFDDALDQCLEAFSGLMAFMAFKYGLVTLDRDVVRNREQAVAVGTDTAEDHVLRAPLTPRRRRR